MPVRPVAGRGALTITLHGLRQDQEALFRNILRSQTGGTDLASAPPSFSVHGPDRDSRKLVLAGTVRQLDNAALLLTKSELVPDLAEKIRSVLDNYLRTDYKINCRGKILDLAGRTQVMGILNVTPDSFSDGGRYADPERALVHARAMVAAGADIIDIGGESTRPGAEPVPEEEELRRIIPLIERLSAELAIPLSVDTYKAPVAKKALEAGASIVNDISGLRFSPDMGEVVAQYGAALIIMHIKGTPRDMQQNPVYADLIGEVLSYLEEGIGMAEQAGVDRERIMIDPGIGFGKTLEHNLTILNRLDEFRVLGRPVVLGTSRKKFIGTVLGITRPDERLEGTAATVALGIERGASVVRVHDVGPLARVARMTDAIVKQSTKSQALNTNKHQ